MTMFFSLFLTLCCSGSVHGSPVPVLAVSARVQDDFRARLKAARGDAEALWKLANWCEARDMLKERDTTLTALLRVTPDDEKARGLLGHVRFDGQWFTSEQRLESYKKKKDKERRAEEARVAKEKGWVRHEGQWVDPADLIFLERGLTRAEDGTWVTAEEREKLAAGWVRQDTLWIRPDEREQVDQGLWKCGEEWLSLEDANAYHRQLDSWWRIPGERFELWSTCDRDLAQKALLHMDIAYRDLARIFGVHLIERPVVLVLRSPAQYAEFSRGEEGSFGKNMLGLDSLSGAYFADLWVKDGKFVGAGVAFWNRDDPTEDRFGSLWARHAAGQSFVEAIDSSPEARAKLEAEGRMSFAQAFWGEKLVPGWLRWGAATYVERYFVDGFVAPGEDPLWTRKWSIENIQRLGGLGELDDLFDFRISPDDRDESLRLMNASGLLVAFMIDGDCAPVKKAHNRLTSAVELLAKDPKKGRSALEKATKGLEKALAKNRKALLSFAGL